MDRNTTSILIEKCHGVTEDVDSYVVDDITYKLKFKRLKHEFDCNNSLRKMLLEHYSRLDEQTNVDPITNKCLPMFKENDVPRLLSEFPSKTEDVIEEIAKLLELSWLDMNKINEDNGIEKLEKLVWRPLVKASQMIPIICIIKRQVDYLFVYFDQQNSMASLEQINLFADTTDVFSSKMDLIVTQFLNIFHFFAKHGIFPAFDLSHFSCEKHLWQAIDLYDIVLSIGSSNYENEQIPRIIDTVNMEDKTNNTLEYVTEQWRRGLLTNYDYLMKLNQFAGRNKKNLNYYPIMPWVHDFEGKGDFSLRPLNKSKYRINKGDLQLQENYKAIPAHHVSDPLTDISVMTYRARVESIVDLRKIVRNTFVAAEYPKSMKLLYKNTPDESIPEFYDDASIFISVHGDEITDGGNPEPVMEDLIVPDWCDNPSNFITWHKDLLNSDKVSANLDEWIDLTFGYLLSGPEAVKALNVYHSLVETVVSDELRLHGPVQLFKKKHPKKESLPYEQAKHRQYFPYESFNEIMNANADMAACPLNESFNLQKVVTNITEVKYYVPAYIKESIKSVAICIAEISVPEHSRNLLKSSRTFGKRLDRAKNLVREYFYKLPRNMAELVKTLIIEEAIPNKILSDLESLPNPLINHFNLSYYMSLTHTLISLLYINRYSIQVARVKNRVDKIKALMKDQISIVWDLSTIPNLGVIPLQYFDLILQEPEENISVCYTLFSRISTCENEFKPMLIKTVKKLMYAKELDKNPKLSYLLRTEFLQQLSIRFGNEVFLNEFLSTVIDRIIFVEKEPKIAELAKHACVWMAKRFGPIITAQHIITKLFILLECCCQNVTDTEIRISRYPDHPMDLHIKNITSVFVEIIVMFGPEFIFKQCLPYIKQKFEQASKNLTPNLESFVIGAMTLMPELCDLISARDFLAYLTNDENQGDYNVIIRFIMIPAIRILKANKATFLFSNVNARRLFASKLLSWIFQLIKRVSRDSTERFLRFGVLDELVSPFSQMYRKVSKVQYERIPEVHFNDQVLAIYDADFAKVCLQTCIEETSLEFFMQVVNYYDLIILISGGKPPILKAPNPKNETTEEKTERLSRAQALQENCEGNRKMKNAHQHISKTWVTAIFNTKESAESKAFNTIELANFEGHTNLIKRICVMDLENCFVTASVDTTVKLWTIKPYETLSHCQYSYTGHSKPLLDTRILAHGGLIASTDGILNIWDPFKSTTLHRLSWDESGKKDNINCLVPLSNYTLAASALTDSLIKIFDVRTGSFAYHMCPFNQNQFPTALVKCMSLSSCGTKMATGFTGSGLSLFDIRTGRILSTRTGIISGITSIEWVAQNHFAGLSNDHSTVICEANTLIKPIHKLPENSSALIPMKNQKQFITFYNNNRLKIYNDYNHRPTEIKTKDAIHGGITAGAYMNLNKTWIVGTSSGKIKLFF